MTEEEFKKLQESAEAASIALGEWARSFIEAIAPMFQQLSDMIREADALKREHFTLSDDSEKLSKFHKHYGTGGDFWKKEDPDE